MSPAKILNKILIHVWSACSAVKHQAAANFTRLRHSRWLLYKSYTIRFCAQAHYRCWPISLQSPTPRQTFYFPIIEVFTRTIGRRSTTDRRWRCRSRGGLYPWIASLIKCPRNRCYHGLPAWRPSPSAAPRANGRPAVRDLVAKANSPWAGSTVASRPASPASRRPRSRNPPFLNPADMSHEC
jgi:hypothetical protein